MNLLYSAIIAVVILGGIVIFAYDQGRDAEKMVCMGKVFEQVEINVEIEHEQAEIRRKPISDNDFIGILRRGEFGKR